MVSHYRERGRERVLVDVYQWMSGCATAMVLVLTLSNNKQLDEIAFTDIEA